MPFDITKLRLTLSPVGSLNGSLHERVYRRHRPKWYSLFCRHEASTLYRDDPFPTHPGEDNVIDEEIFADSGERFRLFTSRCLVCDKILLEGRLRRPDGSESSLGTLYVLAKDKFWPARKPIGDSELLEFYKIDWEFRTTLLADFNKLTIAVAVAAAVFFDKYPSVFYAFIVTCFIMIALYIAAYIAQQQIAKKYYKDAGKALIPTYWTGFDTAAKYLQIIFAAAIVIVLCLMIQAERSLMNERMNNSGTNNDLGKTRPYNPPTKTPTQAPAPPQQTPVKPASQ